MILLIVVLFGWWPFSQPEQPSKRTKMIKKHQVKEQSKIEQLRWKRATKSEFQRILIDHYTKLQDEQTKAPGLEILKSDVFGLYIAEDTIADAIEEYENTLPEQQKNKFELMSVYEKSFVRYLDSKLFDLYISIGYKKFMIQLTDKVEKMKDILANNFYQEYLDPAVTSYFGFCVRNMYEFKVDPYLRQFEIIVCHIIMQNMAVLSQSGATARARMAPVFKKQAIKSIRELSQVVVDVDPIRVKNNLNKHFNRNRVLFLAMLVKKKTPFQKALSEEFNKNQQINLELEYTIAADVINELQLPQSVVADIKSFYSKLPDKHKNKFMKMSLYEQELVRYLDPEFTKIYFTKGFYICFDELIARIPTLDKEVDPEDLSHLQEFPLLNRFNLVELYNQANGKPFYRPDIEDFQFEQE